MNDPLSAALGLHQAFDVKAIGKKDRQKGPYPNYGDFARGHHLLEILLPKVASFSLWI